MAHLFEPLTQRGVTLRNRIVVSPMCQYSSVDGFATDWHLVHLGSRAVGGAAAVIAEATAIEARGRISPQDLGIWDDAHVEKLAQIAAFVREHGAVAGIQLAHAGRKASTPRPWEASLPPEQTWTTVAPSPIPFSAQYAVPEALDEAGIERVIAAFTDGARRALAAGFELLEVHAAHGYLLNTFLSPLSNQRTDRWGGDFAGRTRLLLAVVDAIRCVWPDRLPLWVRVSATDWVDGGWTGDDTVALAQRLADRGVDLLDCSSGGVTPTPPPGVGPGFQVGFAERVRRETPLQSGAVGLITTPGQADAIVREGRADVVLLARQLLRDPYFPIRAAHELGHPQPLPPQYQRAKF